MRNRSLVEALVDHVLVSNDCIEIAVSCVDVVSIRERHTEVDVEVQGKDADSSYLY